METGKINRDLEHTQIGGEREYIELCATLRHYSNLRFLIMPVYFAINGALFLGFQNEQIRRIPNLWIIIVMFSALLAWVFGIVEYKLNSHIDGYIKYAAELFRNCHLSSRKGEGKLIMISILILYVAVAGCWWFFALHVYRAG